jgi:hypothetical protein
MCFDVLWCALVCFGVLWCALVCFGVLGVLGVLNVLGFYPEEPPQPSYWEPGRSKSRGLHFLQHRAMALRH